MTKLLKVRILLPVLLLLYVLLGGMVVPWVDRTTGHLLMIVLALASLGVLVYWFYRNDKYYHDASMHRTYFGAMMLAGVGLLGIIVHHIVVITTGDKSILELFGGEITFVVLALGAWLIYQNNKPSGV
ncbi:MAG TPA: hypothetical protein VIM31_03875 [Candidatus Microsaccharimonas sp.]|jgi:hypothetical protein